MVVMIRRGNDPYQGKWAFPGGFVDIDEDLEPAAHRELEEETGLKVGDVTQLGAYGAPGRDPRMRVVTILYVALVNDLADPVGDDDAAEARVWDVDELLAKPELLAFDHHRLLTDAVKFIER
jgi:8-oxo-dGTP diphosphatase